MARHPGEDLPAVLATRDKQGSRFASNAKLYKIDSALKKLIAALGDISVPTEAVVEIRKIVRPFLEPIAIELGIAVPSPAPIPEAQALSSETAPKASPAPETREESPSPSGVELVEELSNGNNTILATNDAVHRFVKAFGTHRLAPQSPI